MEKNEILDYDLIVYDTNNKIIKSCGDIIVTGNCCDSDLFSGKKIHIKGNVICNKNCVFSAKTIIIDKDIHLKQNVILTIHAGIDFKFDDELESLDNKINETETNLIEITNSINELLATLQEEQMCKLLNKQRILNSLLQYWKKKKLFLENENIDLSKACVVFKGNAVNNIIISINNKSINLDSPVENIKYLLSSLNKIVGIKLNENIN